ncbi:MAG: LCP family protein [Eubacteriales bacterium]
MNNKNISRRRQINNKTSITKIILFTLISILVVVMSFTALFVILYKPSLGFDDLSDPVNVDDPMFIIDDDADKPPVTSSDNANSLRKKDFYTFLIMGRDKVGLNTDIIILLSFDINNGAINILQIPRDTYMEVDSSPFKINAAYAIMHNRAYNNEESDIDDAAMRGFILLLEQNLCIKIDNYALCNISGFRNIIDIIGGVDMDVPYNMNYSDPDQNLYINLKKGMQTLDGKKAEQFIRFRSGYIEGDIGRMDAQKLFISALIQQLKSSINVSTLTGIAGEAIDNVKLSMSLADIVYFVKEFYLIDNADMNFITFPGESARADITTGVWYYVMHRADILTLMNMYFNVYNTEITDIQFDKSLAFTNQKKAHINDIYNTSLSEDLQELIHSAEQINEEGLEISLIQ